MRTALEVLKLLTAIWPPEKGAHGLTQKDGILHIHVIRKAQGPDPVFLDFKMEDEDLDRPAQDLVDGDRPDENARQGRYRRRRRLLRFLGLRAAQRRVGDRETLTGTSPLS